MEIIDKLVRSSLHLWPVGQVVGMDLVNISENSTYRIDVKSGEKYILRVHRRGYHSTRAIECELLWMKALGKEGGVVTPAIILGSDGQMIQRNSVGGEEPYNMVLFEFLDGIEPTVGHDLQEPFRQLGELAAKAHVHAIGWQRPQPFERLHWDLSGCVGETPIWGKWQDGPGVTPYVHSILKEAEQKIIQRLRHYGQSSTRFGLIHADMRLANLIICQGVTRLIDFDDCGLGWFMYDFAASISFMEDHETVPRLKKAWLEGYRRIRSLDAEDENEIDTLILLRRMVLLAWIGSHADTDLARSQAPHFASGTAKIAMEYLKNCH